MSKYMIEILQEVNKEPALLKKYTENIALKLLFQYAFIPEKKFDLPEGTPPFKEDKAPLGMSPANFTQEIRRWYIFTKEKELAKTRKEALFIQLLESLHASEAKLMIAIKDQTLPSLFKNLKADVVAQYGFIPAPPPPAPRKKREASA
jgi:hypothetical protein